MDISDAGVALIANFEGFVGHVYKDVVGVPTIGYGHVVLKGESFPGGVSQNEGLQLLHDDAQKVVHLLNDKLEVEVTQNEFDAMCSLGFNIGCGALGSSTLLKLVNASRFDQAAHEFLKWCHAGGKVNEALAHRRATEMALFLKPPATP